MKKYNWRKRLLSAALALVMTGSLLPAGVFTPLAHALNTATVKKLSIDQNGGWSVNYNFGSAMQTNTWVLAVVPDVKKDSGTPAASKHPSTAGVSSLNGMNNLMTSVGAKSGYYQVKNGSGYSLDGGLFTESGSLSKTIDDALITYATYTDANGNTKNAATDGIPFVAILYTYTDPAGVVVSDTFYWKKAADGELQDGSIADMNGWDGASDPQTFTSTDGGTDMICADGNVTLQSVTTSIIDNFGAAYVPSNVRFYGPNTTGGSGYISVGSDFVAGESYVVSLSGPQPTSGGYNAVGSIIVTYKKASGDVATHVIPVNIGGASAMIVAGGIYTISQGASSGVWTTAPKITALPDEFMDTDWGDEGALCGSYPGWFGGDPDVKDTSGSNYLKLTGPQNSVEISNGYDADSLPLHENADGTKFEVNDTPFVIVADSGISSLTQNTYTTTITYPYYYRGSNYWGEWALQYATIPITIIVTEPTSTGFTVTYTQPSSGAPSTITGWPVMDNPHAVADTAETFTLPNLSATHWTFEGWKVQDADDSTAKAGDTTQSISSFGGSGDLILEAVWTYIPQYTIEYDANGGSGSGPNDQTGDYNTDGMNTPALHGNSFTAPTGKRFVGWSTNASATLESVAAGTDTLYQANETPTMGPSGALQGTAAANGDYTVTLYAIWATPPKIAGATANIGPYVQGDKVTLNKVTLSDSTDVLNNGSDTRWSKVVVIEWDMGNSTIHGPGVADQNGFTIPSSAENGDWVWVHVKGTGPSTPVTADDIAEDDIWVRLVKIGSAEAELTAQVLYYDGTNYLTTKPSTVDVAAQINGKPNKYTGQYAYDVNGNITLTTTYTGSDLTFVGWSTTKNAAALTDNCAGVTPPSGMTHSGAHKIIATDKEAPTITAIMDVARKSSGGTVDLPIPTTVYAIYSIRTKNTLTVTPVLRSGTSGSYTYTNPWAPATSVAKPKVTVSPASATTTGLYGGGAAYVTASIDTLTYDYKFIGWMKANGSNAPDGSLITDATTAANAAPLSNVSVGVTGGMGAATFTMPTTPVATTIFAVYEAIPTQTLTVKKDAGINTVTVKRTRGGSTTTLTLGTGTEASGITTYPAITVRATDTITVTSTAANTYTVNGFDVTGNCTHTGSSNSVTLVLDQNANVTVLAKSKKAPPALTLTATNGQGTQVVSGSDKTTNTTTNASVTVVNANTSTAVVQTVALSGPDAARFDLLTSGLGAASSAAGNAKPTIAAGGSGSITITPDNTNYKNWEVGDYHFNLTITYTNPDYLDANGQPIKYTETVAVKYTVVEDATYTGKVTVKLDNAVATGATVQLKGASDSSWSAAVAVNASGEVSTANLTEAKSIQVNYLGKTYAVPTQLSKSNPNVTVNLYTVTIDLANTSIETGALATSGHTPQLTLRLTDQDIAANTASAVQSAAGRSTASVIVQGGRQVRIEANPGASANALNTGYSFDKWGSGKSAANGNLSDTTNTTALPDIGTTPYTFTVQGKTVYTASLKKENYKVLTYHENHVNAPHIANTASAATNMPSSQVTTGDSTTVSAVVPVLPGYKLKGWSTLATRTAGDFNATSNATDYAAGDTVSLSSGDVDLYAVWEDDAITLTVPTVTDGVYGSNYNLGLTATASSGAALSYAVADPPAGLAMSGASLTGIPQTTGKDNSAGNAIETGYANRAFTPTITVTLGSDYHATGYEVKAILQVDGTGAAATTNNNTKTHHTAKKLTVEKAQPTVTGIAVSGVTAGTDLTTATYTVSVTGPRYESAGWNFAYTESIVYQISGGSFKRTSATPGSVAFSNVTAGAADATKFEASGATTVKAVFTPAAEDSSGKSSSDGSYTSFDAYDAANHKNLQSQVWKGAENTQNVTPGVSSGEMKVKLATEEDAAYALAKSWTYATNATPALNARKGYSVSTAADTGYVVRNASGTDTVNAKKFTLKNTGSIATGELTYTFGLGASSPFVKESGATTTLASGATRDVVVKVAAGKGAGTYTDTLTISNATSGVSVSIFLSFTVDPPMAYKAYVTVLPQAIGAAQPTAAAALPSGLSLATTAGSGITVSRVTGAAGTPHLGEYEISGLLVGTTYQLKITGTGGVAANSYTIPGVSLSYSDATPEPTATVKLYEVGYATHKEDHSATETSGATYDPTSHTSGAGWYVDGQHAAMTAHNGYSVTASGTTTNYVFANSWTKSVTATNASTASTPSEVTGTVVATDRTFVSAIAQPTTFYAHYKEPDAATFTLHHDKNTTDTVMVPPDQTASESAGTTSHSFTISSAVPTRTGYTFVGWSTAANRTDTAWNTTTNPTTDFAPSGTISVTTSDANNTKTLYAVWKKAEVLAPATWTETLPNGMYGESYSYQVTIPTASDGAAMTVTAKYSADGGATWVNGLPGGLKLDPNTGHISGKPYMVNETGFKVKLTATHSYWDGTGHTPAVTKQTGELTLKVMKHPVTLTGTSVTNVVAEQLVSTGHYETTVVKLPLYGGKDDGGNDIWNTVTTGGTANVGGATFNAFTETVDLPDDDGTANVGTLSITNAATDKFSATTDTTVNLRYTPSATAVDAHGNKHNQVYAVATTSIKAPGGGANYDMKIKLGHEADGTNDANYARTKSWSYATNEATPKNARVGYDLPGALGDTGYVTRNTGSADTVDAKKFVLKNTGNQATGTLTYTFGAGANTPFELESGATTTLAAGATRDILVKVKTGKGPGTYTDTLVITNANGVSVSASLSFVVEKADVPVAISTYLWDVGDTVVSLHAGTYPNTNAPTKSTANTAGETTTLGTKKKVIPNSGSVKLVDMNDPTKTKTAAWNATDKAYNASIDYDTTYNVVINGYTVPGVTISRDKTSGHIYLYQVKTAFSPNSAGNVAASAKPTAVGSVSAANGGVTPADNIYVVRGEATTVTVDSGATNTGYNWKELQDTTTTAAPGGDVKTTALTYTAIVDAPVEFTAVYTKGYSLTYKPNASGVVLSNSGVTPATIAATDVVEAVESGNVTVKAPGVFTKINDSKTYTGWTRPNYTFVGWSTNSSQTAANFNAAANATDYAPGDTIAISASEELFAIWAPNNGLEFEGKTITVAHYDKLADNVVSATGNVGTLTYTRDIVTLPGGTTSGSANIIFDAANHKFTSGSNAVKYDTSATNPNNSATTTVTATDGGNSATVSADFTIEVVKAETAITKPWDGVASTVKAGDAFDFTKLTITSGPLTVSAYKTDGATVNPDVNFDETPTAANGATGNAGGLGGKWTVTDEAGDPITNFLPGKNKYVVTFTPTDTGFKPSSTTIELTLEKAIKEVTVSLTFPVDGAAPSTTATIEDPAGTSNVPVVSTTNSPTAVYTDAVVDGPVIWTYTAKKDSHNNDVFDRRDPVTAIVKIKPKTADNWKFVTTKTGDKYDFVGNYSDLGTTSKADKDVPTVTVLNVDENGESATLLYTWLGEDTAASNIKIRVNAPTDGGSPDKEATPIGTPLGSFVTTGADSNYTTKWYEEELSTVNSGNYTTLGAEATTFTAGGKYVVIVTATVNDGYYFQSNNATVASKLAALDGTSAYATINDMNAKVLAVTEVTDNNKRATKVTLAVEFTVNASEVVGLVSDGSKLDYYVMTDTGAQNDLTGATLAGNKHHDATATGHNSGFGFTLTAGGSSDTVKIYAIDKNGDKALTSNVVLFVDGTSGTTGKYDTTDVLLSKKVTAGSGDSETTTYSTPGYTFLPKSAADLTSTLDGKTLYAAYVDGNGTKSPTIGATDAKVITVGTLHVKPLEAKTIAPANNWSVDANKKFQVTADNTTVTFNTGDPMATNVATVGYAARAESLATSVTAPVAAADTTKTRPNYYYMLDANGDGQITGADVELKANTDVSAHGGKSVYICYTDVNGHLVTAKAGVIGANFTVDIDDENGQDPEYGDKLTGEPKKPDGSDAAPSDPDKPFTYQWEKEDPDHPGTWVPIPGATSPDYVPGKDDVGGDIRVSVTDPGTGTTVSSDPEHIEKRSINFDVAAVDKLYDGDFYNDDHAYTAADFTAKQVEKLWVDASKSFTKAQKNGADTPFGGLLLGDKVTIAPYDNTSSSSDWNEAVSSGHHTGRPTYKTATTYAADNAAVGSAIQWPWVLEKDTNDGTAAIVSHAVNATDGYTLSGADKDSYRLRPQDKLAPRGVITNGEVTHVDVSFKEWPTYDHVIPGAPMGVTDDRETMAGEKTEGAADEQTYTAKWYKVVSGKTFDPSDSTTYTAVTTGTAKFESGAKYAVAVTVKPKTGYHYELDETKNPYTRFYFHFGEYANEQKVEVTDNDHAATTKTGKGVWVHDSVYTMYCTLDEVKLPDIAYVNVSVPQPVADVTPAAAVTVIQLIGTDNEPIATNKVSVGTGEPVWKYLSAPNTWTKAEAEDAANNKHGLSATGKFLADTQYQVTFSLNASDYKYLYTADTTPKGVRFVASGEGELKDANINGTHTLDSTTTPAIVNQEIIESVVTTGTTADGKEVYTVTITYKPVKSGEAALMDVVVDASAATQAGVEKTGPAVSSDKQSTYDLNTDANSNKWFYWNTTNGVWEAASDGVGLSAGGKFLAGYDYKVEGKVKLVDTAHYNITPATKFYIAGYEVTATDAVEYHPATNEKALTPSASAVNGVYPDATIFTLVKTFRIPAEDIGVISVTHNLPLTSGKLVPQSPDGWTDSSIVTITPNSDEWVKLGTTDASKDDFTTAGTAVTEGTDRFEENTYYRVTSTISPEGGYQFKTDSTKVVINGVAVTVDGDAGQVKNSKGETVAYVKAVLSGGSVKAMLVAKVESDAINPIELRHDTIVPVTGGALPTNVFALLKGDEDRYVVDTTASVHNGGKGTWQYVSGKDTDGSDIWTNVVVDADHPENNVGVDENGKFLGDTKYRVTVGVKTVGDTNVFATNAEGYVTVDSLTYTGAVTVAGDRKTADVTVTFNPTSGSIKNVTHVDVSFKEVPTFSHKALPVMGVTDARETQAGEGTDQTYTATWYQGVPNANFDPMAPKDSSGDPLTAWEAVTGANAGTKTYAANTYTVVVQVKPKAGYSYNLTDLTKDKTRFYFHFGEAQKVEVNTAASGDVVKGLKVDEAHGVYYMWYTFTVVAKPKIAYVNVSVPQPVAEVTPGSLSVIQVIGTDNQPINTNNVTGSSTVEWQYLSAPNTWTKAEAEDAANNKHGLSATGKFLADTQYRVNFTLTAGGGYEYLYTDDNKGVRFVASGEGELENANIDGTHTWDGNSIINDEIIESVVTAATAADGKTVYTVTITYKPVKSGKANMIDVVVDASAATQAGVVKTGPSVTDKPYELTADAASNKWFYWNTTNGAWEAASDGVGLSADGKFLAAHDYKVEGKVKLVDTAHYQIVTADSLGGKATKFYIAGYEVTTTDAVEYHPATNEKALTPSASAVNGVYPAGTVFTLVKTFRIEEEKLGAVTITYPEPEATKEPLPNRNSALWTYEYLSEHVNVSETVESGKKTVGTTWYKTGLTGDPTQASDFAPTTDKLSGTFAYGAYYMVEGIISADLGYVFDDSVDVTINGILVKADGTTVKAKYDDHGNNAIGWAMAKFETNDAGEKTGRIIARYIAKTVDPDTKVIDRVEAEVATPAEDTAISDTVALIQALFENNKNATDYVSVSDAHWTESDSFGTGYGPVNADGQFHAGKYYQAVFTVTTKTVAEGYTFQSKDTSNPADGIDDDFVAFRVNNVTKANNTWVNDKRDPAGRTDEATRNGIKVITEQADGDPNTYTVTVQFPLTGEPKDVLVIGNADVPASGDRVSDAEIWVDNDKHYEIIGVNTAAEKSYWEHWDGADWVRMTNANETFKAGDFYRAVMEVEIKAAEKNLFQFTDETQGRVDTRDAQGRTSANTATVAASLGNTAPSVSGLKTTMVRNKTDGEVTSITLAQEFRVPKIKTVVEVDSPVPTAGAYTYQIDPDIKIHTTGVGKYTLSDGAGAQGRWYDAQYNLVDGNTAFEPGKTYYLITTATAEADYIFSDEETGYKWYESGTGALKAPSATTLFKDGDPTHWKTENGETVLARVAFEYTIPAPEPKVIPGFANQPIKGHILGDIWTDTKNFEEVDSFWSTDAAGEDTVADTTAAAASTVYYATIDVIAKDGVIVTPEYSFNGIAPGGDFIKAEPNGTKDGKTVYRLVYRFKATSAESTGGGGGGGSVTVESPIVYYHLKDQGVTDDPTAEKVKKNGKPKNVPVVKAMAGLVFKGWSEVDPSTLPEGKLPTLVDPTTFKITSDKTFYAVYERGVDHNHYVIGFPNGTFGPDAKITRAEVATIIARSCLEGFVEGANYGNPGNYTDVSHHWAFSAIAFCAKAGVFTGYEDGTFRPDRYITRQELATVVARLAGIQTSKGVPFNDKEQIASWAVNGIYTAFANGWIKGYEDGTFRPEQDVNRAETVKIFNGYLKRGVDAKGLEGMKEYVHTGVASNNTEDGHDEYMTWPDVPKTHWAYYEIIEAANDHNYHWQDAEKQTPPEDWDEVYINEKWKYNDNLDDGADKRDENISAQKTFTVTYLVSSNGVTYDAITETVDRFASPKPENMPIAVPNEGYRFAGWSSTDPSTGTVTLVDPTASGVTADKWFYAVFEKDTPYALPVYTVTYVINGNGSYDGATVERVEMFQAPSPANLPQPTANEGYRFAGWSETDPANGDYAIVDPTANYVTGDKTFYAVFEEDKPYQLPVYTVTYVIGSNGSYRGATVEQVEMFQAPSVSGLPKPTAKRGYRFVGWSETDPANGDYAIVDPTANYVTGDKTFYAVYKAN